jgi:RluA family pseudouridine synthase
MTRSRTTPQPISILFEDNYYMVVNKPAGWLMYEAGPVNATVLLDELTKQFEKSLVKSTSKGDNRGNAPVKLYPCHRLDRGTSGAVIFAKGKAQQKTMMECFQNQTVHKHYTAFVHGRLEPESGEIRKPVKDFYQSQFAHQSRPKDALTRYRVLQYGPDYTVVDVEPLSGRTHQIRIHFKEIGHPLVGEDKYAFRKDFALKFKRPALHAREIDFRHPVTGKAIHVEVPLPTDMINFLKRIRT